LEKKLKIKNKGNRKQTSSFGILKTIKMKKGGKNEIFMTNIIKEKKILLGF
jgi:hypothetical protein